MNRYNAQILNDIGEYHLQFETDNKDNFKAMERLAQRCVDNKPQTNFDKITESVESLAENLVVSIDINFDKITESVEGLAENLVVSIDMDFGGLQHRSGDGKLCDTWEEAVNRTIEWLKQEVSDENRIIS